MGYGGETRRLDGLPLFSGATNIAYGNPVKIGASRAWEVMPVEANSEEIVGVVRASVGPLEAVDIRDTRDIIRGLAAATISVGEQIGVASMSKVTSGASGNVLVAQLAPVTRASASNRWAVGVAVENAVIGAEFAYYVNPRQISGLT